MKILSAAIMCDGIVYPGESHSAILEAHPMLFTVKSKVCGFVTDAFEFVDRKEALKLALAAKQVNREDVRGDALYSCDLRNAAGRNAKNLVSVGEAFAKAYSELEDLPIVNT